MSAVGAVIGSTCDPEQLVQANCETLQKVVDQLGAKILELIACIGQPVQIGDERYADAADVIPKLLGAMEAAERICTQKRTRKGFSAWSLPTHYDVCGYPVCKSEELIDRYNRCCLGSSRVPYGVHG